MNGKKIMIEKRAKIKRTVDRVHVKSEIMNDLPLLKSWIVLNPLGIYSKELVWMDWRPNV